MKNPQKLWQTLIKFDYPYNLTMHPLRVQKGVQLVLSIEETDWQLYQSVCKIHHYFQFLKYSPDFHLFIHLFHYADFIILKNSSIGIGFEK